ncbi:hypothetical protein AVEN_173225-1 [Araneus ventricosus]|uniref:Uncharacterized protein n=1 Tax=Araneus ventricosus TaxID=182803 RepID=A0A4Y1ZRZ4_ARAVE|nr:hypothetical protein AVEN_173225-1 [Araneus ventricosus]
MDDHTMHARSANIASSVEFCLPSEIVTAVEIVEDRFTDLYRSQVLHQAKTPPKGNFSSSRLLTKAPSDHSNRVRSFAVASLRFTQKWQLPARFDSFRSKKFLAREPGGPSSFLQSPSLSPSQIDENPIPDTDPKWVKNTTIISSKVSSKVVKRNFCNAPAQRVKRGWCFQEISPSR